MAAQQNPNDKARELTRARARAMAQAVVSAFTTKLKAEARKHGGSLSLSHIESLDEDFQAKAEQLTAVFEQSFQDAHREQEELKWHAIKRPAFDRMMVKRFEGLLFHRGDDGQTHGVLSRRMLPGFFLALNMMMGPEAMSAYQRRSDQGMERVMGGRLPADWDLVDQDPDVRDVVLDAQYTIALYFEDPEQRAAWFTHIVNTNLSPAAAGAGDTHWELSTRALHMLINDVLSDLKAAVADDGTWTRLALRHEDADRDQIREILQRLEL